MQYSYWSGEVQGIQEKLLEDFNKNPTLGNAFYNLVTVMMMRSDFTYFKKKQMLDGELLPLDRRLVRNVLTGLRNSIKAKLRSKIIVGKF